MQQSYAEFEAGARAQGFDQVLVREWKADQVVGTHSHPFDVSAVMVQGDLWLTIGDGTRHIVSGGTFEVPRNTPHAERYGSEGAKFWVARRTG